MPLGLFGVLFLVFLVLKLLGIITWSWWLITMPLWGGIVVFILCVVILTMLDRPTKRK